MTLEEFTAIVERIRVALNALDDNDAAATMRFEPGDPADIMLEIGGNDIVITVSPA
jgi:hypothetical protein